METIKACEFKAKCLQLMDQVAETGESIVVTKNGKPVAQLAPLRKKPETLFGIHKGKIDIVGDIMSPIDVTWNATGNATGNADQ